ncbi:MAG: RluA family pseudouridine synthase [Deltaproteobacteria bacterium]|nr:RluA family pseudouridine synthase [Deltaproteobacteria bacterium]
MCRISSGNGRGFKVRERLIRKVPDEMDGSRLDRLLRRVFPDLPAKSIRFAIEGGDVAVGGKAEAKGRILRAGEVVSVRRIADRDDWLPVAGDLPGAAILHEDGGAAVLLKPANVHTEPQRPLEGGTLAGYLRWKHPEVMEISREPGLTLLTRLDYATSGAVPAALSGEAFEFLRREREKGRIVKTYICLVSGRMDKEMSLSFLLDPSGGDKVRVRTDRFEEDPLYWTYVRPIRISADRTLVRAVISKGKRHQIRAHLAAAGYPIVGDRRYGTVPAEGPGKLRLMLHAGEVRFTHPSRKEPVSVSAPLPEEFGVI